ncbi:LabA-like NYN domain-containing protein [Desulfogranum mediterraneum]|uniref:LabA-like NYN domain-containing protein n=1 Tax=Desulfogranum mediterraneum TaxID=160661 RepID=UPI0003F981F1|nr:NYN domain-containing protein [Desulfogranum mediterraneum]
MLKTGIYVDAENIKMSGGYGMRYDVLVDLANDGNSTLLRANCYLAEDRERTQKDGEYRQKVYSYHNILRQCGFKVIKKYVRRFQDEDGNITTKANADMDLAIDALLQARNLDRIILLTGDGDFIRLVIALQNMGCRVEVIGFHNVSGALREVADSYLSGYLIPGLLPIIPSQAHDSGEEWQRGTVANFNMDRGFGFFRYYRLRENRLSAETIFFHLSKSTLGSDQYFLDFGRIFEFRIVQNPANENRSEAWDIRLLKEV